MCNDGRGDIPSCSKSYTYNRCHRSSRSKGHQQGPRQTTGHTTTYDYQQTSVFDGDVPPSPASSAPPQPWVCATERPKIRSATQTRASHASFALANGGSTEVRVSPIVRRQHFRGNYCLFGKVLVYLMPIQTARQLEFLRSRTHWLSTYLLVTLSVAYRRQKHALRAWFPSAGVHFRRREPAFRAPFPSVMVHIWLRERTLPALLLSAVVDKTGARG